MRGGSGVATPRKSRSREGSPAGKRELKAGSTEQTRGYCHDKWCRSQGGYGDRELRTKTLEMRAWQGHAGGPTSAGTLTRVGDVTTDTKEPTFPTSGMPQKGGVLRPGRTAEHGGAERAACEARPPPGFSRQRRPRTQGRAGPWAGRERVLFHSWRHSLAGREHTQGLDLGF